MNQSTTRLRGILLGTETVESHKQHLLTDLLRPKPTNQLTSRQSGHAASITDHRLIFLLYHSFHFRFSRFPFPNFRD